MKLTRLLVSLLIAAVGLNLIGCFSSNAIPLEVVSISPEIDASDVLLDAAITIETSAELDETTVTVDSVKLFKGTSAAGTPVSADVTVSAQSIAITPTATLDFGTAYTIVISGTVADVKGNLLSGEVSWGFRTKYLGVVVSANGLSLVGVTVTLDGSFAGTTNSAGELAMSLPSGGTTSVAASPKFFVPPAAQNIPLDGSVYDVAISPQQPHIFVADVPGAAAPSIIRLDTVDAALATYETITSVNHGAGPVTYTLAGPRWIEVDYQNGIIYVVDAASMGEATTLIRMTNYPPALDGSEAEVVTLTEVWGTQQFHVMDDGRVILPDYRGTQSRVVELPASLIYGDVLFGGYQSSLYIYGIDELPSGELLFTEGTVWFQTSFFKEDDYTDTTPTDFVTDGTVGHGSLDNEFYVPTHVIVAPAGDFVYVSDTGEFGNPTYSNSRLVRYSTDGTSGTAFVSYGVIGTGTGTFYNPMILGLLPDNKLYIMDVANNRIVRIDPGAFDNPAAADWTESDAAATFTFNYWYNYS